MGNDRLSGNGLDLRPASRLLQGGWPGSNLFASSKFLDARTNGLNVNITVDTFIHIWKFVWVYTVFNVKKALFLQTHSVAKF